MWFIGEIPTGLPNDLFGTFVCNTLVDINLADNHY